MLEEPAIVVKTDEHKVWITGSQQGACGGCAQKTVCTGGNLAEAMPAKRLIAVDSDLALKVGDSVIVKIEEAMVLRASFMMYVLPLVAMLVASGLADWLFTGKIAFAEFAIAGFGISALLLSLYAINHYHSRHAPASIAITKPD
jgi:sigma-E factor negative regulatory protein RseC